MTVSGAVIWRQKSPRPSSEGREPTPVLPPLFTCHSRDTPPRIRHDAGSRPWVYPAHNNVCELRHSLLENRSVWSSRRYSIRPLHAPLINRLLSVCGVWTYYFLSVPLPYAVVSGLPVRDDLRKVVLSRCFPLASRWLPVGL